MKKFTALCMMVIALGFVTVGCDGGSTAPATAPADSTAPAADAPADPAAPAADPAAPAE